MFRSLSGTMAEFSSARSAASSGGIAEELRDKPMTATAAGRTVLLGSI
ncbi:hypothetical protein [Streptomyces coffeae]|uniref:Uncharacterized protein n=1 Tax=Streptomyces coffeae TaxID=621382 RepID=A0ABS1NEK4_9ACTN|nr:hypothetical protein [Streptomyces coffeae]MBL1098502.1 hypothetical protein [Streptomyces coffeae]